MLYLERKIYLAFIKLQADKGLGRSYAGLLPFCEGLFRLGYLDKETYEASVKKYSVGLVEGKTLTPEEQIEQQHIKSIEQTLTSVLEQWSALSDKARARHIRTATENQALPIAKRILEKQDRKCVDCGTTDPSNPYRVLCPEGEGFRDRTSTCASNRKA